MLQSLLSRLDSNRWRGESARCGVRSGPSNGETEADAVAPEWGLAGAVAHRLQSTERPGCSKEAWHSW
jgi:hypothetical protein